MRRFYWKRQKRHQIYYFRLRVPVDLQKWMPLREVKKSLKTKSLSIAKSRVRVLLAEFVQLFGQIRSGTLSDQQVLDLLEKLIPSELHKIIETKPLWLADGIALYPKEHISLKRWGGKTQNECVAILSIFMEVVQVSTQIHSVRGTVCLELS